MRTSITIGTGLLVVAAAALWSNDARADEIVTEEVIVAEEVVAAPPGPDAASTERPSEPCCTVWPLGYFDRAADSATGWLSGKVEGLELHSGLSAAFQWDFNDPPGGRVPYRFNDTHNGMNLDLFQVSLGYNVDPEPGDVGARVVFDAGRLARRMKADWNGSGIVGDSSWESSEMEVQEAWIHYDVPIGRGLVLRGGRFASPLGNEKIEPWENPTFSRSYLFYFGSPLTFTGGTASYAVSDKILLSAGGVVGWDNVEDNNSAPSAIGQIILTPSEYAGFNIGGVFGPEQTCRPKPGVLPTLDGQGCDSNMRGLVDLVLNVNPTEDFGISLNFGWGSESGASLVEPGRHAQWVGASGTLTYDLLDCFELAARGEWFQDAEGARLRATDSSGEIVGATVWAVTLDAKAMLSEYLYVRAEYRYDGSPQEIFAATTSSGADSWWRGQNTVALELGYSF